MQKHSPAFEGLLEQQMESLENCLQDQVYTADVDAVAKTVVASLADPTSLAKLRVSAGDSTQQSMYVCVATVVKQLCQWFMYLLIKLRRITNCGHYSYQRTPTPNNPHRASTNVWEALCILSWLILMLTFCFTHVIGRLCHGDFACCHI